MGLKSELEAHAKKTHDDVWRRRKGDAVPDSSSVTFGTDAVELDGTVLYADLTDSTGLVNGYKDWFAAEVYKNYLYTAARIIRDQNGTITAYDGDRVMAVFIGNNKNTAAAKTALKINWAVRHILQPALGAKYPESKYKIEQKIGIDTSPLFVAKTGIRGSDDLVWVGKAANNAAKMATLDLGYSSYITHSVYGVLNEEAKYGGTPKADMWSDLGNAALGFGVYGSTYWWSIP
ncbi:MAG: hypothetical protein KQH57_15440 [Actinomycetales bacterium]|nr:hypothetical protein [Actinomycetales bacterium]